MTISNVISSPSHIDIASDESPASATSPKLAARLSALGGDEIVNSEAPDPLSLCLCDFVFPFATLGPLLFLAGVELLDTGGAPLADGAVLFGPLVFGDAVSGGVGRAGLLAFIFAFALGLGDMRLICGDEVPVLRLALFGEEGTEITRARGVVGGLKLDGGGVREEGDSGVLASYMETGRAMLRAVPATEAVDFILGLPLLPPIPFANGNPLRDDVTGEGEDGLYGVLTELEG